MSGRKKITSAIFLLALIVRLAYVAGLGEGCSDPDEEIYVSISENFLSGRGLILSPGRQAAFPPLYPLFLAGSASVGLGSISSVRFIQAVLSAISAVLVTGISLSAFAFLPDRENFRVAALAGIFSALYPPFIYYSGQLMTETLFVFLISGAVFLLLQSCREYRKQGRAIAAGIFTGAGILCRPTLLIFAALVPVWLLFFFIPRFRLWRKAVWFSAAAALVLVPWTWRNYRIFHRIVPVTTQSGNILYLANNPAATGGTVSISQFLDAGIYHLGEDEEEISYYGFYGKKARAYIRDHPGRFVYLCFRRLAWFLHLDLHGRPKAVSLGLWAVLLAAGAGMWFSRRNRSLPGILVMAAGSFVLIHMVFPPEGRYRLPAMPFLLAFAALGTERLAVLIRSSIRRPEE